MVHKEQNIKIIVERVINDLPSSISLYFARPAKFTFAAGDWVDLKFGDKQLLGGKTYSISASPTEDKLRITFREGVSQFKKAMQSAQAGDTLTITQYGNDYNFQLKKNQSSVLIAGGIGVAPFRSMLKEMFDNDERNEVTLIYLNQNDTFLFRDELDFWSEKMPNLTINYIPTNDINRKKREKLITSFITSTNQNFYISGPPEMVESNEHLLVDIGVNV
ncbi:FAD-dependent oxidoreductase, partial [Candidatus Saccharibacteria bacterium]|nr:FAD-dependent oxidoreductase [Candidatus Saccharibacteria bacterium]